jgi:hypothetical protein
MVAHVPLAALSALLDALNDSRTGWERFAGGSRHAALWAAITAAEAEAWPEEERAGLLARRATPPIGADDKRYTYAEWCRVRDQETDGEGRRGNGQGGGYWPGKARTSG